MVKSKVYVFAAGEFTLWQHTNGYWYAFWRDEVGKRRKRAMKTKIKSVAEQRLPHLAEAIEHDAHPTFRAFAESLLGPEDAYVKQKSLTAQTIYTKKRCIEILADWFGSDPLGSTRAGDIERRLANSGYSPSYQGELMNNYRFVLKRAERDGFDVKVPHFYRPDRNVTRRDSLTPSEVQKLFPDEIQKMKALYCEDEDDEHGVMFALLYRTILHGGLRPGEGRAVGRHQLFLDHNTLLVSRRLDRYNQPVELKKRRYGDSDVYRLTILPSKTVELLQWWLEATEPADFLFLYEEAPVRQRYISERWNRVLERAEINTEGRKVDVQALRTTYRSI
ncbi:MAG: hypothetical protein V3S41_01005, partial [Spirochaetia bacterium]